MGPRIAVAEPIVLLGHRRKCTLGRVITSHIVVVVGHTYLIVKMGKKLGRAVICLCCAIRQGWWSSLDGRAAERILQVRVQIVAGVVRILRVGALRGAEGGSVHFTRGALLLGLADGHERRDLLFQRTADDATVRLDRGRGRRGHRQVRRGWAECVRGRREGTAGITRGQRRDGKAAGLCVCRHLLLLLLLQLQSHEGVDEVGADPQGIELDAAGNVPAAVPAAAAWKRETIHLAFDPRLATGTSVRVAVDLAVASAKLPGGPYVPAFLLLERLDLLDARRTKQGPSLSYGDRLQKVAAVCFQLGVGHVAYVFAVV